MRAVSSRSSGPSPATRIRTSSPRSRAAASSRSCSPFCGARRAITRAVRASVVPDPVASRAPLPALADRSSPTSSGRRGAGITACRTSRAPARRASSARSGETASTVSARRARSRSSAAPIARAGTPPTVRLCRVTTSRCPPRRGTARAARAPARSPWAWTATGSPAPRTIRRSAVTVAASCRGLGRSRIRTGASATRRPALSSSASSWSTCAASPPLAVGRTSRTRISPPSAGVAARRRRAPGPPRRAPRRRARPRPARTGCRRAR